MSHLLGLREFYGREFRVTKDVLDPRPDTETLIASVLESGIWNQEPGKETSSIPDSRFQILDLGTGSGCIIITLLKEIQGSTGVGLDISQAALEVAKANKERHGLEDRLELFQGSMFDIDSKNRVLDSLAFDVIVSNPPYITTDDMSGLMPEVRDYEPNIALDGGKDGLDYYRQLAKSTPQLLNPNGLIFLEIGAGQASDVADIFQAANWQLKGVRKDLSGHERCIVFKHQTV